MLSSLRSPTLSLIVLAASAMACSGASDGQPPSIRGPLPDSAAISWRVQRGILSATGTANSDQAFFTSNQSGSLRVVIGGSCDDGALLGSSRQVSAEQQLTVELTASGLLADDGVYSLQACFTSESGERLRAVVLITVKNTPPTVQPSLISGSYCGPQYVKFSCPECTAIAHASSNNIEFNAAGELTAGSLYTGQPLAFSSHGTVYYRGLDKAGNTSAVQSASYAIHSNPTYSAVARSQQFISINSPQNSSDVTLETPSGLKYAIRVAGDSCKNGSIIASGDTDLSGTTIIPIAAALLPHGANDVFVCVSNDAGCTVGESLAITRKDAALGLATPYPNGAIRPPVWHNYTFSYLDEMVDVSAASMNSEVRLGNALVDFVRDVIGLSHGQTVQLIAGYLPEGHPNIHLQLSLTDALDEAQNTLPADTSWNFGTSYLMELVAHESEPSYEEHPSINGDIVISSRVDNAWWRQCAHGQGDDCADPPTAVDFSTANQVCAQLHHDSVGIRWRLPYLHELLALVDYNYESAQQLAPEFARDEAQSTYWTATSVNADTHMLVDFATGIATPAPWYIPHLVRCIASTSTNYAAKHLVRGNLSWNNEFEPAAGGTVVRIGGGIIWQQSTDNLARNYAAASNYCSSLGSSGWHLPTSADFATLMEKDTRRPPSLFSYTAGDDLTRCFWVDDAAGGLGCHVPYYNTRLAIDDADEALPVWCVHRTN